LKKKAIYFGKDECVMRIRVQGQKYITYIEIDTNFGNSYSCGT